MMNRKRNKLRRDFKATTRELALLNRELAAQMILLASQTGNTKPLVQAVSALRAADQHFEIGVTPRENAEVRQALADTLLTIGRAKNDETALRHALKAYRDAITLASLLGDQKLRATLKKNYAVTQGLLEQRFGRFAFRGAA